MRLEGKVAIVTGAGSGIGRASALLFAQEGARVVVVDRNPISGESTAATILSSSCQGMFVQADVSTSADVQKMVHIAINQFGRVDILFNNAGMAFTGLVHETTEEDFDRVVGTNLKGTFLGCKYVLPSMMRNQYGVIINLASGLGLVGSRHHQAYSASKGGVVLLTRSLALAYGEHGIRANCVCPGPIKTPMMDNWIGQGSEALQDAASRIPMKRLGQPEEVAQVALFLASTDSSYMNGAVLTVDGGELA
jgi:NAD(P)-dependent dehydrogenase (short-subunit alcohol dehydrogenase family)